MQVNWFKLTPWIISIILLVLLLFKSCGKSEQEIKVKVPEVSGKFEGQKPEEIGAPEIEYIVQFKDREIKIKNPVNDSLLAAYKNLEKKYESDSLELERLRMYVDAIQIRQFKNHFEDEYISLDVFSEAQGYVKDVRIDYTLKEREITHQLESSTLRLLLGAQLGFNQDFNSFPYKLDVGFQNSKGHIIEGSYMRLDAENYFLFGSKISLFKLK
tara:strand:- start:230 stop:871 length:642 start_codon:yes stop_codon:yes gene_type:complete